MNLRGILVDSTPPVVRSAFSVLRHRPAKWSVTTDSQEQNSAFYDEVYRTSTEYRKHYTESIYYFLWCVLVDRLRPDENTWVFDVGCGPGQLASLLYDRGVRFYQGIDFSSHTIQLAKANCPAFHFKQEDAYKSDLFDSFPYTALVTTEFLEHVEGDLQILSRVRKGTRVFASVPNFSYPGHVRFFSSCAEVAARYEHLFSHFRVDNFTLRNAPQRSVLYLFEGIRN
jgi:2-polyprenyl-3-methyl-5-hydroxy-6-metoxy-1,4-benzoquinol methylase